MVLTGPDQLPVPTEFKEGAALHWEVKPRSIDIRTELTGFDSNGT